ncbi:MAG: hypothetical protein M1840_002742 [Geoglossum simile]|nr:MAG: hypothetical protein M1840_002742 [Geoglossum simile]
MPSLAIQRSGDSSSTRLEPSSTGAAGLRTFTALRTLLKGLGCLDTQFRVVVRFGRNGAANGIYIIYDFYPEDEYGERGPRVIDDSRWGRLPKDRSRQQFSIAKLADMILELRFGRTFTLMEVLNYPVELVRTVKTPEDAIIRVTIA